MINTAKLRAKLAEAEYTIEIGDIRDCYQLLAEFYTDINGLCDELDRIYTIIQGE